MKLSVFPFYNIVYIKNVQLKAKSSEPGSISVEFIEIPCCLKNLSIQERESKTDFYYVLNFRLDTSKRKKGAYKLAT